MGLSPYEKKSYRESKRRRRQALLASETGYIRPYKRSKKPWIILLCVIAVLAVAAVGAAAAWRAFTPDHAAPQAQKAALSAEEQLRVVNRMHALTEQDVPPLVSFGGVKVHAVLEDVLSQMTADAAKQGIKLTLRQGYVSFADQQKRYEENLAQFTANPEYTPVRAQAAAQRVVPEAGCSEFQTGLLLEFDVSDPRVREFLERECIRYGLILRYPDDKEDLTHRQASASQYRYVGTENAEKMRTFGMCLEEYTEYISYQSKQEAYEQ